MNTISYERDEGYNAFLNNKEEQDNPYEYETDEYNLWLEGFNHAKEHYHEALYEYGN